MTFNYTRKIKISKFSGIEALNKDNYDMWKLKMEAILFKNDAWMYVNGECKKSASDKI